LALKQFMYGDLRRPGNATPIAIYALLCGLNKLLSGLSGAEFALKPNPCESRLRKIVSDIHPERRKFRVRIESNHAAEKRIEIFACALAGHCANSRKTFAFAVVGFYFDCVNFCAHCKLNLHCMSPMRLVASDVSKYLFAIKLVAIKSGLLLHWLAETLHLPWMRRGGA
jgi:hypothetical protein